jgi:hypothetical protein
MCRPARCSTCGKTTWTGCGQHVADVRARVAADQWCPGHRAQTRDGSKPSGGLLSRFRRR